MEIELMTRNDKRDFHLKKIRPCQVTKGDVIVKKEGYIDDKNKEIEAYGIYPVTSKFFAKIEYLQEKHDLLFAMFLNDEGYN